MKSVILPGAEVLLKKRGWRENLYLSTLLVLVWDSSLVDHSPLALQLWPENQQKGKRLSYFFF